MWEEICADDDVGEDETDSLAKAAEDIGYDDISDDELDDLLIEGADDEQEEKPTETIGNMTSIVIVIIIRCSTFST